MSKIEWTDETWNITTGCTRVSAGCDNCYAVTMTKRLAKIGHTEEKYGGLVNEGKDHFNGTVKLHPEELEKPLHWRKPRRVFVNSMSDLFHPEVPNAFIRQVFGVMACTPQHTYQVLTKRPERMAEIVSDQVFYEAVEQDMIYRLEKNSQIREMEWPLKNVWLGTSVENQKAADTRIPHLLKCTAAVRFLSCEPLLGPVDLSWVSTIGGVHYRPNGKNRPGYWGGGKDSVRLRASGIHWVIAGGESGPDARPMHPDWVRGLRDQCTEANVPFFFKQWGKWVSEFHPAASPSEMETSNKFVTYVDEDHNDVETREEAVDYYGQYMVNVGKKKAGRQLDGQVWNQFPISEVE